MAEYNINKGIGQSVEFKGLKAQYLFIFAGGLLAIFVLFVILFLAGVSQWVCIGTGVVSASLLVWQTFALILINRKKPYQTIKNKLNQRVNEKYPESNDR